MTTRRQVLGAAVAGALGLGVVGGVVGAVVRNSAGDDAQAAARRPTVYPVGQRPDPPALDGPLLGGGTFALAQYAGHPVVVNAWASWCGPCHEEMPDLVRAAADLAPAGVRFLGLNAGKDTEANARAFVEQYGVDWPTIFDGDARNASRLARVAGGTTAIPFTVVLDARHQLAAVSVTVLTRTTLVETVRGIIGPTATGTPSAVATPTGPAAPAASS